PTLTGPASPPPTLKTNTVRAIRNTSLQWASVLTWAVLLHPNWRLALARGCRQTGKAASSAPVTAPPSTWPVGYSPTCRHPTTLRFLLTNSRLMAPASPLVLTKTIRLDAATGWLATPELNP